MITALHGCSLPCFSLPCAVDVLTTGTYSRLPACIRVWFNQSVSHTSYRNDLWFSRWSL